MYGWINVLFSHLFSVQGLGFTDNDSAGQTNIFAVEPKSYVQGSQSDGTSDAQTSTQGGAAIGGTVAVGVIVAGIILLNGDSGVNTTVSGPEAGLKPLSEYAAQFTSEIAAAAPVAAPSVVDE
jgi:hypothetical protein